MRKNLSLTLTLTLVLTILLSFALLTTPTTAQTQTQPIQADATITAVFYDPTYQTYSIQLTTAECNYIYGLSSAPTENPNLTKLLKSTYLNQLAKVIIQDDQIITFYPYLAK